MVIEGAIVGSFYQYGSPCQRNPFAQHDAHLREPPLDGKNQLRPSDFAGGSGPVLQKHQRIRPKPHGARMRPRFVVGVADGHEKGLED